MNVSEQRDPRAWLGALAGSHDRLVERVRRLDAGALRRESYCTGWSVAQVLSHLGSGAEIFRMFVDAALSGREPPATESFPSIWDRWNAMSPEGQAEEFASSDGALVEGLEELGDRLDGLRATVFGGTEVDAVGLIGMRLSEHGLHSWDVMVTFDPSATLDPEVAALLVDRVHLLAGYAGTPAGAPDRPFAVTVRTVAPPRRFLVHVADGVRMERTEAAAGVGGGGAGRGGEGGEGGEDLDGGPPVVTLPAEALVRLVAGRLDPASSPAVAPSEEAALDKLREVFRGF